MQNKVYDLEERTKLFAISVRAFVKRLTLSIANREDIKQVVRSSGSIGANYIEANENLGTKDFLMRIRICRKEAKETIYWLSLIDVIGDSIEIERNKLQTEATELMRIFGAILTKSMAKIS